MDRNLTPQRHSTVALDDFFLELQAEGGLKTRWCMESALDLGRAVAAALAANPGFRVARVTDSCGRTCTHGQRTQENRHSLPRCP